jgi:hypothetical protein
MRFQSGDAMDEYVVQGSIGMPRGGSLRIDDGCGILIYVWEGELWLTQEGSRKDHMLGAGSSFRLDRDGAAIALSFRRSVVTLTSPEPECRARRIALIKSAKAPPIVLHRDGGKRAGRVLRRFWSGLSTFAGAGYRATGA